MSLLAELAPPCRIAEAIWIPGAVAYPEDVPEIFETFCEEADERDTEEILALRPEPVRELLRKGCRLHGDEYTVAFALRETPGFLLRAETPLADQYGDWTWGCTQVEWLYAPTEADIAPVACACAVGVAARAKP